MEVKAGYRQTEVGVIPEDWDTSTLGEIGETVIGLTYRPDQVSEDGVLVLRSSNIQNGTLQFEDNVYVNAKIPAQIFVQPNDVLICVRNGSRDLIGKTALLDDRTRGMTFGAFMAVHRSDYGKLVHFLFQSAILKRQINEHLGATINQITNKSLNAFPIPLAPTDSERHAISEALSDVDALLLALDRLIAKKTDLKQAAMQRLLTGRTRLPGFKGKWKREILGDYLIILKNGVNSRAELLHEGQVKYLHYGDIHSAVGVALDPGITPMPYLPVGKASHLTRLEDGDLIFADASEDLDGVGKSVELRNVNQDEIVAGQHTLAVRFDKQALADGFKAYLQFIPAFRRHLRRLVAGTKVYATNRAHIASAELQLPPIDEQIAIAAVLTDMNAEISVLESRREKTYALKQAMMQELLTGRTRLVQAPSNVIIADFSRKSRSVETPKPTTQTHNWQINEAVVIGVLALRFGDAKFPLSRKRRTKLAYFLHRFCEGFAEGYLKKAAGPYNPKVKYQGPEKIALKNGYVQEHHNGTYLGFVAGENSKKSLDYFSKWYDPKALDQLEQLHYETTENLGVLATVDMSANEIRQAGKQVNLETVKDVIRSHPEWEAKLEQPAFSDISIAKAIRRISELFSQQG